MTITAKFNYPVSYRLGVGLVRELPATCRELGISRPLVVTDPGVANLPWFSGVTTDLEGAGLGAVVYSDVHENPVESDVTGGLAAYRASGCDGVILLGGGSPLDVGKCVALLADNPGSVLDYEDVGDNWTRIDPSKVPPMIAIPTTSGTGSEVGRASVIVSERHEKKIIFHPKMQPPVVIADPALTFGLPRHLTAFTGLDAFTHSFEAFCAPFYHPMADGIALEGMRLVSIALERACDDGHDADARTHMMVASSMGATAFQKGLGVVHAIAHALGGRFRIHHGMANALLLPYCMQFNRAEIEAKCAVIARHLELPRGGWSGLFDFLLDLRQRLGVPHALSLVPGLEGLDPAELAPLALSDPSMGGNPRGATELEMARLIERTLGGHLD